MGEIKFSEAQRSVIESRDCSLLVSAAAGSGKTAVLVRRIIERICDLNNPVDIDEILVLTYTNAAASEMRERISKAIRSELDKGTTDEKVKENLKRQSMLIYNATITTIHSFCLNLLRNNFSDCGLEPDFRIADEGEMKIIEEETLDETIEEILLNRDIEFLDDFLERFANKDKLNKIKDAVSELYKESLKAPIVLDYLNGVKYAYDMPEGATIDDLEWVKGGLIPLLKEQIGKMWQKAKDNLELCENYVPEFLGNARDDFAIISDMKDLESFESMRKAFLSFKLGTRSSKKGSDEEFRDEFIKRREEIKKVATTCRDDIFGTTDDIYREQAESLKKVTSALADITIRYHNHIMEKKLDRKIVTFDDMEHYAVALLLKKDGDTYIPSDVAREYKGVFKEIMIDEYQDSNYIQESILSSISTEDLGIYNRFMVGDIKQSIYRFRNARPDLFMDKYKQFSGDGSGNTKVIDLSSNYRSRKEVIDSVNAIFEKVMTESTGGVDYDEKASLHHEATYYPESGCDNKSELLLLKVENGVSYNAKEQEALLIADRIRKLISDGFMVYDKSADAMRACEYRDIVILIRSGSGFDDALRRILEMEGIPAYVTSKKGYFDSEEVATVLNYLKIIDNPYDDIAMFGTLKSVFGGFSEDEIAILKMAGGRNLYKCLKIAASDALTNIVSVQNDDIVTAVQTKAKSFLKEIEDYREKVPYTPINKVIREILNNSGYINEISSGPLGEKKKANVLMLLNKAEHFESNGSRGLFNFNRYIKLLHKYGSDDGEAAVLDENANVVRIMTMHKSKGLEFPVCIVAGLSKDYNMMDARGEIIFDARYGLGMDYIDTDTHAKYRNLKKKFISMKIAADSKSEEMRVLYVALTRAEEKLIMTGTYSKDEVKASDSSHLGNIISARGDNNWSGRIILREYSLSDIYSNQVNEAKEAAYSKERLKALIAPLKEDDSALLEKMRYEYPHREYEGLYTKTSVSELKLAAMHDKLVEDEEALVHHTFETEVKKAYIPTFATDIKEEAGGAKRGSAYHRVMELYDFSEGAISFENQMKDQIFRGALTEEEFNLVDGNKIERFFETELCNRMRRAADRDELFVEQPFVLGISADRLGENFPEDENVLIQGIIDAFFIEDGEIVLMDYKTDSVNDADELKKRYMTQLEYYDEAIRRITGYRVKEKLIYSFKLEQTIKL